VLGADRAERVASAMRCRGFDGTFHTTATFRTTKWDALAFAGLISATMALILWDCVGLS
jgi:cobalt/nickel transport system permease protein